MRAVMQTPGNRTMAVRVTDPRDADMFLVPFFSSLSLTFRGSDRAAAEKRNHELQVRWGGC